ncbi:hypothetical protein HAV15_003449 [Penicillium sp. str. |nr:hypothetical protein HAV15_003449 [Penicillium sp. str. \
MYKRKEYGMIQGQEFYGAAYGFSLYNTSIASAWETLESENTLQATDRTPLGEWTNRNGNQAIGAKRSYAEALFRGSIPSRPGSNHAILN